MEKTQIKPNPSAIAFKLLSNLFIGSALFASLSHAETKRRSGCVVPEKENYTFQSLVGMIRDERCQAKSLDDVISLLPERMRSNFVLFFRSQSLQGPHQDDPLFPRAILSSARSVSDFNSLAPALMISFNGHPTQPGYDRLEAVDLNPLLTTPDTFTYYEISFPNDAVAQKMTWTEAQLRIKISEPNPKTCQQCHGSPARPIFQAYPLWEGAFGSLHASGMSKSEKMGFEQFVRHHKSNKESRYRHLNPGRLSSREQRDFTNRDKGLSDPLYFGGAEPTIQMNTDLSNYNGLRVARMIRYLPFYFQLRFAIAGAFMECRPFSSLFTEEVFLDLKKNIDAYYRFSGMDINHRSQRISDYLIKQGPNQFGDFWSVIHDKSQVTPRNLSEVITRQRVFWEDDPLLFALWTDTIERQGRDRVSTDAVRLRFIFEGHGINLSNWWADLKQPTYRSNSGFGLPWILALEQLDLDLKEIAEESGLKNTLYATSEAREAAHQKYCKRMATLSRQALRDYQVPALPRVDESVRNESQLDSDFPRVFQKSCVRCHVVLPVGPPIPFNNPRELEKWLRVDQRAQIMKWRTLHAPETKRMPPNRDLTVGEQKEVENYLNRIMSPAFK